MMQLKVSKKFSVLKYSKMSAVIIEIDFISNNSVEASTLLEFANKKIEN